MEENKESKGFLIDGYPRELQQGVEFEQTVSNIWINRTVVTASELAKKERIGNGDCESFPLPDTL